MSVHVQENRSPHQQLHAAHSLLLRCPRDAPAAAGKVSAGLRFRQALQDPGAVARVGTSGRCCCHGSKLDRCCRCVCGCGCSRCSLCCGRIHRGPPGQDPQHPEPQEPSAPAAVAVVAGAALAPAGVPNVAVQIEAVTAEHPVNCGDPGPAGPHSPDRHRFHASKKRPGNPLSLRDQERTGNTMRTP